MDDWYCQVLALNKVNIQGKYNMKTLLTLLLLLSSNIIFAGDAGSDGEPEMKLYKGALGDIFDLGMTDQDTGTQTPEFKRLYLIDIDEGRDLYQVQLALAYSARDTALLEKKYAEKGELTDKEDALIQEARHTTRAIAYMAVASKVYTARKNAEGDTINVEFADYSAYIDSVNIYGEEDFMTETAFSVLKGAGLKISPIDIAILYLNTSKDAFKNANVAAAYLYEVRLTNNSWFTGNAIQTMLMNLGQSIYTTCVSCPERSK
mgnify:FL=1